MPTEAANFDTEIFVYKDATKATKLFQIKAEFQQSQMSIATYVAVANNNDFISGKEFTFDINVAAYMKNEANAYVLRKDQDISISISSCD